MTRKLINILFRSLAVIIMLIAVMLILLSVPVVQNYLAQKTTQYLEKTYGVDIDIQAVRLGVTGDVRLKNVFVKDHHNDTLILAKEISTTLKSTQQILKGNTNLQQVNLKEAYVKMVTYPEDDKDNMRVFFARFAKRKPQKATSFTLHVDRVNLENCTYSYTNSYIQKEPIVNLKQIELSASQLDYRNKEFKITAQNGALIYNDGIEINQFSTAFKFVSERLDFDDIILKTKEKSDLQGNLIFRYESGDFSDFNNCVTLTSKIKESAVASNDLKYFYNEFGSREMFYITTDFYGTLNDFQLHNLKLEGLGNSNIVGDMSFQGARSKQLKQDFSYEGNLKKLQTTKEDLERLLPSLIKNKLPTKLSELGAIKYKGYVSGTSNDVDFNGNFDSSLGNVDADIRLENIANPKNTRYNGQIAVQNFQLGSYFENPKLGATSFDLNVNGKGFLLGNLSTVLEGRFSKLTYNGYEYKNINVFGLLDDPVFDGQIDAKDPNFDLVFNGKVNLSQAQNDYDFEADVNFIDLRKTKLVTRDSISTFKGQVKAKLKGTTVDNVVGNIYFNKTTYTNQNESYVFKDFNLNSKFLDNGDRSITVDSPEIITGYLKGDFKLKEVKPLVISNLQGLYLGKNNKQNTSKEKYIDFDLKIYNKILGVFYPELSVASNTFLKGFISNDLSKTRLNFNSPKVDFEDKIIEGLKLFVDKSKRDQTVFRMDAFKNKWYPLRNFEMLNQQNGDSVVTKTKFKAGKKFKDQFDLRSYFISSATASEFGLTKAAINFKNNEWKMLASLKESNKVIINKLTDSTKVYPVKLVHKNEEIRFSGKAKDSTYKDFQLTFKNVDLEKISPAIDSLNYYGNLNGRLLLRQKGESYLPEVKLNVDDFTVNDKLLGDLSLFVNGNESLTTYLVQGALENDELEGFNIAGKLDVVDKKTNVAVDVLFGNFDLSPFSPLGGSVISNIRGKTSGKLKIGGTLDNLDYNGELRLNKTGIKIPYLNVDLSLEEDSRVSIQKNAFVFAKQTITDKAYNTKGFFEGKITHQNFIDWNLNLSIESPRLLALNTTAIDNDLYYGTAFINGYAKLTGSTKKPFINVVASSEEGTKFKIPISDTESIGDNSFIHFITPKEKQAQQGGNNLSFDDVKGVEMQFELDLNQNAEVEVVVDKASGSALRGYGAGTLLIEINTNGKFNMWGDFVAYKGTYDFKYGGVLSKSFEVESGGSINWNGSPTGAFLNLSAVYNTNANPAILLENSTVNRKIPVQVVTSLRGELLKPDLNFDIKFPRASSVLRSELDFILADQTLKERQAFSLVTQGQFYNDALINGNNLFVENLLVERASNIVNSLFANDDDKFKVGLNYVTGERNPDQEIADQVGVSVSTQISERILINGKVGVPVGGISESVVVGDVQIDFLLNDDGTLRATIFNKENDLQFIGETIGFTQGVGLSYSYDFNTFKELIRKIFTKAKEENDEINEEE